MIKAVETVTSGKADPKLNMLLRNSSVSYLTNWVEYVDSDWYVIKLAYVKLFNRLTSSITIGPVDRSGNKMATSLSHMHEGKIWSFFKRRKRF